MVHEDPHQVQHGNEFIRRPFAQLRNEVLLEARECTDVRVNFRVAEFHDQGVNVFGLAFRDSLGGTGFLQFGVELVQFFLQTVQIHFFEKFTFSDRLQLLFFLILRVVRAIGSRLSDLSLRPGIVNDEFDNLLLVTHVHPFPHQKLLRGDEWIVPVVEGESPVYSGFVLHVEDVIVLPGGEVLVPLVNFFGVLLPLHVAHQYPLSSLPAVRSRLHSLSENSDLAFLFAPRDSHFVYGWVTEDGLVIQFYPARRGELTLIFEALAFFLVGDTGTVSSECSDCSKRGVS